MLRVSDFNDDDRSRGYLDDWYSTDRSRPTIRLEQKPSDRWAGDFGVMPRARHGNRTDTTVAVRVGYGFLVSTSSKSCNHTITRESD